MAEAIVNLIYKAYMEKYATPRRRQGCCQEIDCGGAEVWIISLLFERREGTILQLHRFNWAYA
jgi:hypothetical protein